MINLLLRANLRTQQADLYVAFMDHYRRLKHMGKCINNVQKKVKKTTESLWLQQVKL